MNKAERYKFEYKRLKPYHRLLPKGHQNVSNITEIATSFGTGERKARSIILSMASVDLMVCNKHDGKGYYIPATKEELDEYREFIHSYVRTAANHLYRIDKALKKGSLPKVDMLGVVNTTY